MTPIPERGFPDDVIDAFVQPIFRVLACLVLCGIAFGWYSDRQRYKGRLDEALAQAEALTKEHTHHRDTVLVTVQKDGVTVTKRVTEYRTLRDTVTLTDTVTIAKVILAADSMALACTEFQSSCQRALAADETLIRDLNRQIALLTQMQPSRLDKIATAAKWLAVGAGVGAVLSHR